MTKIGKIKLQHSCARGTQTQRIHALAPEQLRRALGKIRRMFVGHYAQHRSRKTAAVYARSAGTYSASRRDNIGYCRIRRRNGTILQLVQTAVAGRVYGGKGFGCGDDDTGGAAAPESNAACAWSTRRFSSKKCLALSAARLPTTRATSS